jgi:hypothetical protein
MQSEQKSKEFISTGVVGNVGGSSVKGVETIRFV